MDMSIKKALKKHRCNLSYDDAATVSEVWVIAKRCNRSFYREWQDHWDGRGYDEYIVAVEGRIDTGITPTVEDKIITLSTCSGSGSDTRWVVQAVRKV